MAFNLSKNNGVKPEINLSKSTEDTKFNLSKNKVETATVSRKSPKSNKLFWPVLLVLLLAIGLWWLIFKPTKKTVPIQKTASELVIEKSIVDTVAHTRLSQTDESGIPTQNVLKEEDKSSNSVNQSVVKADLEHKIPATFMQGAHDFSNVDEILLKNLLTFLNENPQAKIQVNGFASSEGKVAFNQRLSEQRANRFKTLLVSKGIEANRISALGKGIADPIASNDTEDGRLKNRRVELSF